jgi:hypothetical protein
MSEITRSDLEPGQIFRVYPPAPYGRWPTEPLVVLDRIFEVGFWTGARYALGDVAPAARVEVL